MRLKNRNSGVIRLKSLIKSTEKRNFNERRLKHTLCGFVSGQIEPNNDIGRLVIAWFLLRVPSFASILLKTILAEAVPVTKLTDGLDPLYVIFTKFYCKKRGYNI